jgi:hypothetical protein
MAATRQTAAPSKAAINGPSGSTQEPSVIPNTGAALSRAAAQSLAHAPNNTDVRRTSARS